MYEKHCWGLGQSLHIVSKKVSVTSLSKDWTGQDKFCKRPKARKSVLSEGPRTRIRRKHKPTKNSGILYQRYRIIGKARVPRCNNQIFGLRGKPSSLGDVKYTRTVKPRGVWCSKVRNHENRENLNSFGFNRTYLIGEGVWVGAWNLLMVDFEQTFSVLR